MLFKFFFVFVSWLAAMSLPESSVSGRILSLSTNEPLPYCNIVSVTDPTIGTISNARGEFILKGFFPDDSLEISQIGYRSVRISVNDLSETVYLEPHIYELDAAVVLTLDFPAFIQKVRENIHQLFPEDYPIIEGVFRKQVVENQEYVFMGECALAVRNTKRFSINPKVSVSQSYVTVNEANLAGHGLNVKLKISSNLLLYPFLYVFDEPVSDDMHWELRDIRQSDNGNSEVYILIYEWREQGRSKEKGVVYVRAEDYGILRIDREMSMPDRHLRGLDMTTDRIMATYHYQKLHGTGKYVMYYSRLEWCFSLSGKGAQNQYTMTTDFLVTNFESKRKNIHKRADMDPFELGQKKQLVDKSDLRVIPPDYE